MCTELEHGFRRLIIDGNIVGGGYGMGDTVWRGIMPGWGYTGQGYSAGAQSENLTFLIEVGQLGRFQVSPPSLDRSWIGLECGVFGNYFESGVCHFRGVP